MSEAKKKHDNIKLYVTRVLLREDHIELIPEWLTFVEASWFKNIVQETLKQSKIMSAIKKNLEKQ